jgi:hypothetical protein
VPSSLRAQWTSAPLRVAPHTPCRDWARWSSPSSSLSERRVPALCVRRFGPVLHCARPRGMPHRQVGGKPGRPGGPGGPAHRRSEYLPLPTPSRGAPVNRASGAPPNHAGYPPSRWEPRPGSGGRSRTREPDGPSEERAPDPGWPRSQRGTSAGPRLAAVPARNERRTPAGRAASLPATTSERSRKARRSDTRDVGQRGTSGPAVPGVACVEPSRYARTTDMKRVGPPGSPMGTTR